MDRLSRNGVLVARLLMAVVFVLNGFGVIDQTIPAKELVERGAPASLVPLIMWAGRALELAAGFALALGIFPRLSALALFGFLVPAIFAFVLVGRRLPRFQGQLINFLKNMAIWGGLIFIAATPRQPTLLAPRASTGAR
jgi:putative oxidoreductase